MEERVYYATRYFFTIGMIVVGSCSIFLTSSLQFDKAFDPVFQTALMFLGEFLGFIFIFLGKKQKNLKITQEYPSTPNSIVIWYDKFGKFAYIFPATCEFINSVLEVLCYNYLQAASIVSLQILAIIYVLYYRIFHVNRNVFRHHKLGISFFLFGIVFVIFETAFNPTESHKEGEILLAIGLMAISELFAAFNLISVERLMHRFHTSPGEVNFLKGSIGLFLCILLYYPIGLLLTLIFPSSNIIEPLNSSRQAESILYTTGLVLVFCLLNFFAVVILKFTEALTVCTINSGRIVIVWTVYMAIDFDNFDILKIIGAFLVILGLLIYNEFLIIPCCGLKESAQQSMEENAIYREKKYRKVPVFLLGIQKTHSILQLP